MFGKEKLTFVYFFQIFLVILAKFLSKIGGRGEGGKRPPITLKFYLGTFYDICAQWSVLLLVSSPGTKSENFA